MALLEEEGTELEATGVGEQEWRYYGLGAEARRDVGPEEGRCDSTVPLIKIKVYHDSYQHDVTVPAESTFEELKRVLDQVTGLAPDEQMLLFRGKETDNHEYLDVAGVKDMSKIVLLEDPASRERKIEQRQRDQVIAKACEAVTGIGDEVGKLIEKVMDLESSVRRGTKVADQEFVVLTELLIMQLLKLDGIEAEGEAKVERKIEVRRIQHFVEMLDALKLAVRNSYSFRNSSNGSSSTTQTQTIDSGRGEYASIMIKKVTTPSRVRPREPFPSHTDEFSSAHKRRRPRHLDPSRASTDWSTSTSKTDGGDFESEISSRRPSDAGPQNEGIQDRLLMYLRDLISNLNPMSPKSFDCFTSKANAVLDFLAHNGLVKADLRYWEELCRKVEFLVSQFKALSIVHTRTSLPELRQQVGLQRVAIDTARGEYQKSVEAMQRYRDESSSVAAEMESLSYKIKSLEGELTSLRSCKTDLQVECNRRAQAMETEQQRLQIRHRAMTDAKVALTKVMENLKATEVENRSLDALKSQLRLLQSSLL